MKRHWFATDRTNTVTRYLGLTTIDTARWMARSLESQIDVVLISSPHSWVFTSGGLA